MCNIDEIMDMLDWRNSEEIQQKGIELAKDVKCINAFIRPADADFGTWDNCAEILADRPDEILVPYLSRFIEWIGELAWPGAMIIFNRLLEFSDVEKLASAVEYCVGWFTGLDDPVWLGNIAELLDNSKLKEELVKDVLEILQNNRRQYRVLFKDKEDRPDKFEYGATTFKIIRQEIDQMALGESPDENLLNIYVPEATSAAEIEDFIWQQIIFVN